MAEAISLGHDLGHTPFGHAGEDALNKLCSFDFRHNEQSLRVVTKLENDGQGLNLCFATRDGILNHKGGLIAKTLEGQIVNISDTIAYVNHDIDDSIRARILQNSDLPKNCIEILGENHSQRINTLVLAMINYYYKYKKIGLEEDTKKALMDLRKFMFENVYISKYTSSETQKAKGIVNGLFEHYIKNEHQIPVEFCDESIERNVADYIAGMTDRYAINIFDEIFVPKSFIAF